MHRKELNNLDDNLTGIQAHDYSEFNNNYKIVKSKKFLEWIYLKATTSIID